MESENLTNIKKIHTIGNQWNVQLEVMQSYGMFSEKQMSLELFSEFNRLNKLLEKNSISYSNLKSALTPPNAKKKFDYCFIFDSSRINDAHYSLPIFKIFFEAITTEHFKNSNNSIFSGDLLYSKPGFYESIADIEVQLNKSLKPNETTYYVIFVSNLTANQKSIINEKFESEIFYIGVVDWTLKNNYIKGSLMLPSVTLKSKRDLLLPSVEEGYKSILESVIPRVFKHVYIEDYLYDLFLSYNYHSYIYSSNKDYSYNILNSTNAEPISNYTLVIEPNKFEHYIKKEKSHVIRNLDSEVYGDVGISLEEFTLRVKQSISNNIFNIEINSEVIKFNTILDTKTTRMFFSFEYKESNKTFRLITAY